MPLLGFVSFDDEPEQYLMHARLRPGNSRDIRGVIPFLRRTVPELRHRFPRAKIRVRADAGFYHPLLLEVLEELGVEYVIGMPANAVLRRKSQPSMVFARVLGEHHIAAMTSRRDSTDELGAGDVMAMADEGRSGPYQLFMLLLCVLVLVAMGVRALVPVSESTHTLLHAMDTGICLRPYGKS